MNVARRSFVDPSRWPGSRPAWRASPCRPCRRWLALLALLAIVPANCARPTHSGDGTVQDDPEPVVAVDLTPWQRTDVAILQDEAPAQGFSQELTAVSKLAAAEAGRSDEAQGRGGAVSATKADAGTGTATVSSAGWEVQFPRGNTIETYARILDFFGFELGVMQPNGTILYVYSLSKEKPDTRSGPAAAEKRCYLSWTRGDLSEADRALLSRAGVDAGDKVVLKFLRPEIEALLTEIEKGHAGKNANRIERTRFGIRRKRDGYDFFVLEQSLRGG